MAIQNLVYRLRQFRSIHKWIGISVFLFMIITASTGVLLGWKKNVNLLQPSTVKGSTLAMDKWVGFDQVAHAAMRGIDSVTARKIEIDRMDVRPDKGIIKVTFKEENWEAQIDGGTGKVLSVAQRHADWIEHIHDGSIISESFKIVYTNYLGWGLLFLSITGLWLWYGPKVIRKAKNT
ncbi:MAG: PepSY domain-containing protein [Cyclobacteriaceae bacterium]|nr:PepSY domain-containing protein [Cyclobacteriaceae bacterium]